MTSPRLSRTLFTVPTGIPLNFTGAPTLSPFTSPLKNRTAGYRWRKKRPDPKIPTAATPRTTAPTTNAPMTVVLARLLMRSSGVALSTAREEAADSIVSVVQQLLGIAPCRDGPRLHVEENTRIRDGEDARQLVGHDDDRGAQAAAKLENQLVEEPRADRVETCGRLVEEQIFGVERHGARETGALLHAAADLVRVVVLESLESDECKLERCDFANLRQGEVRVLLQRQPDVLGQRHRAPQGSALEEHPEASQHGFPLLGGGLGEARSVVQDLALCRLEQPDQVVEQGALPAPAAAHDDAHVSAVHGEVEIPHDDEAAERHRQMAHLDVGLCAVRRHQIPRM